MIQTNCKQCNKVFLAKPFRIKEGYGKFCGRKCYYVFRGGSMIIKCPKCGITFRGKKCDQRKFCSRACLGQAYRGKFGFQKGHTLNIGPRNGNWKGGLVSPNTKLRQSKKYAEWRASVFARDNFTCQWCRQVGGKLNADHIKPFALFPDTRFAVENGRTLCVPCHKKTDTYLHKAKSYVFK